MINNAKKTSFFKRAKKNFHDISKVYHDKGLYYLVITGTKIVYSTPLNYLKYSYYSYFKSSEYFSFQYRNYQYFFHYYNTTWNNERAVEIPIIWDIVKVNAGKEILEVGNVLSNYFKVDHDVLDKYDKIDGVINQDVVYYNPPKKYNLIISISTLEHVGWDEDPREPMKILDAFQNLQDLLLPGGKMAVTLPLDLNEEMDKLLKKGKIDLTEIYCLKRKKKSNEWIEADCKDIFQLIHKDDHPKTNKLIIGLFEKK